MYEFIVAQRHILRNPKMAMFTVLAVTLAVAVIVVMMGLMDGFQEEVIKSTVETNPHIIVQPKLEEKYVYLYRTVSNTLWKYPEVIAVSPRLSGKTAAKYKDKVVGVDFMGIDPADEDRLMNIQKDVIYGRFMDLKSRKYSAFIGTKMAADLKIKPESDLTLVRQNQTIKVRVIGLFETGTARDKTLIYLPLSTAQQLLGEGDVVSEIGVKVSDINKAQNITADLNSRFRYQSKSWVDLNRDLFNVIQTQSFFSVVFYALIFAIAGFGIANTMIMIITRRTREIGILMAMGARRFSILKIFIIESLILAPPSAIFGSILAYFTAEIIMMYPIELPSEIYYVSRMTVAMKPEFFIYAMIFAMLVNFAAGIYPAYKASRMDPVEAIGSE